jgi:uncharacterized membrane protein
MSSKRTEAFSDGVFGIVITIMILELKTPHGAGLHELQELLPIALRYLLSFLYIGLYWVNHHALFDGAQAMRLPVLWANLHLLFWISLIPFVTAWAGEFPFAALPSALYGLVLLMSAIAYALLASLLNGASSIWRDRKYLLSIGLYAAGTALAFWYAPAASALHAAIALMWLAPGGMPNRRR